jgi:hypothetical protein
MIIRSPAVTICSGSALSLGSRRMRDPVTTIYWRSSAVLPPTSAPSSGVSAPEGWLDGWVVVCGSVT